MVHFRCIIRKYGSSISMTHWYTGNEVPANVHTLGFSGLVVTAMPKVTLRKIRNFKTLPFILCRN
jgi:hypothetical protein